MVGRALLLAAQSSGGDDVDLSEALPEGLEAFDWIRAAAILIGALLVARLLQAVFERVISRAGTDIPVAHFVAVVVRNLAIVGGIVYALGSLGVQLGPLLGALGISGLAIAFAAQTILENVFASIVLRTRRPFVRGDQITVGDHSGTVDDINFRVVALRTFDGERALLPCGEVLRSPIVNHTAYPVRRTTLMVGVAYDTDLDGAERVLRRAVGSVGEVRSSPEPEVWVEQFNDSSIDFAVRYWHVPDEMAEWRVRSQVAKAVKAGFDEAGITIPFPQRTLGFLPSDRQIEVVDGRERDSA